MPAYHLLNVFTAEDGTHGNPLGVFLDDAGVAHRDRQRIATELGYSETVFIEDAAEVDALHGPPESLGFVDCWAWIDEDAGTVRARVFVADEGIPEDEATGLAALNLAAQLGRAIEIRQGKGSVLYAKPGREGTIEVGGRVVYRGLTTMDRSGT